MELDLQGWKVKLALVALVALIVAVPLARASHSNKSRADDWRRRALVAEEAVAGLQVVIVDRSRALNQRTIQANRLATELDSNGLALRQSKSSIGSLSRRQKALASENARVRRANGKLDARAAALQRLGLTLNACTKDLAGVVAAPPAKRKAAISDSRARLDACRRATASFDAYLERPQ